MTPIETKPGWKTTEFWLALVSQVITILVLLKVIAISDAAGLETAIKESVVAVMTVIGSAMALWKYIQSRISTKEVVGGIMIAEEQTKAAAIMAESGVGAPETPMHSPGCKAPNRP
jgi:hypothetical protein